MSIKIKLEDLDRKLRTEEKGKLTVALKSIVADAKDGRIRGLVSTIIQRELEDPDVTVGGVYKALQNYPELERAGFYVDDAMKGLGVVENPKEEELDSKEETEFRM